MSQDVTPWLARGEMKVQHLRLFLPLHLKTLVILDIYPRHALYYGSASSVTL
jgi:hypothetical protein